MYSNNSIIYEHTISKNITNGLSVNNHVKNIQIPKAIISNSINATLIPFILLSFPLYL